MKKLNWHQKMFESDKLYGSTTVGSKGQVVIPAEARKDLGLKPGDRLVVMGKFGKALGFIKSEHLSEIVAIIMEGIEGRATGDVKAHLQKMLSAHQSIFKSKIKKSN